MIKVRSHLEGLIWTVGGAYGQVTRWVDVELLCVVCPFSQFHRLVGKANARASFAW